MAEKKVIFIAFAIEDDRTNIVGVNTKVWSWDNIRNFIDSL